MADDFVLPSDSGGEFRLPSDTPAQAQPKSMLEQAATPIMSYPETYGQLNREAREQIGHGVSQLTGDESSTWERAKGAGNVALGTMGYAASPINAALRTVVGRPLENVTGVPKEYSEFAA